MLRNLAVVLVLLLGPCLLLAEEVKGKVKFGEIGRGGDLTVTVDDKDVFFKYVDGTKLYDGDKEIKDKEAKWKFLRVLKTGAEVTVIYDEKEKLENKFKAKEV